MFTARSFHARLFVAALVAFAAACRATPTDRSSALIDDFGDTVRVGATPHRIVSLNPTTTEMLFALGAGSRLVGRTHWDVFPDAARAVPDLGNGIAPNIETVLSARPDLVVLYATGDNRAAARALRSAGVATVAIRVDTIGDFRRAAVMLGRVIGDSAAGRLLADTVTRSLEEVRAATKNASRPTVFWRTWDAPVMTVGRGSYLDELLTIAGARNLYGDLAAPSPQVSLEDVIHRNPDYLAVGPASREALVAPNSPWRAIPAVRANRLVIIDTMLMLRPSVRLGEAAHALAHALHPDAVP